MLASYLPVLDLASLFQFVFTALLVLFGALLLVKNAASKYFVVDANFDAGEESEARRLMSIGGGGSGTGAGVGQCIMCGIPGTKRCSGCKGVRYCSQACQSKHWVADHKLKCKKIKLSDKIDSVSSITDATRRGKASVLTAISLVPARGTCKVLEQPQKILFPYDEFVKLYHWDKPGLLPCGLLNCGNSCFANVVLQCLTCTRPLMAYLLESDHKRECTRKWNDWCFLCELQVHIGRVRESLHPFSPINILSRLPNIGGNLGYGRQEDAHEFMRFAIDTMQSVCLDEFGGEKALDPSTQETTLINYIFGGHLQSQVICSECNMISNRYENMMDLTVEIQGDSGSLEECLDQFTVKERLDGENLYKCDGCNDYVKAWKRLTVHQAPNILTIALKRFQSGRFGKLNKRVTFPEDLDLTPYMSGTRDGTDLYMLYAVVVHVDMLNASYYGHYICYTKDYHGHWYRIDDCKVINAEVEDVLAQGAYMLFYSRRNARREPFINPLESTRKTQLTEEHPESSSIPVSMNSDSVSVSLPSDVSSGSNLSFPEKPSDISLSRESGNERESSFENDIMKEESEDTNIDVLVKVDPLPVHQDLGDVDIDDPEISSLQPKDLEEGSSSHISLQPENVSFVEPMQSKIISPAKLSSIQAYTVECHDPCVSSTADSDIEEVGSVSITEHEFQVAGFTSDESFSSKNIVHKMAETPSTAFMTASSPVTEPLDEASPPLTNFFLMLKSQQAIAVCGPSNSSNGVMRLDEASLSTGERETKTSVSCGENYSSRAKLKPLFSPGYLDMPVRKKSVDHEERTQVESNGIDLAPNVNGCSNWYSELDLAQRNVHDHDASSDLFSGIPKDIIPGIDKPFISRGFLNNSYNKSLSKVKIVSRELDEIGHPSKTNCNGSVEHSSRCQSGRKNSSEEYRPEMSCLNGKLFSRDSKDIIPGFNKPFISRGFLNNSYNKSLSKDKIVSRELDGIGHPSKTNCNGPVEHSPLCQSGRKNSSEEYGSEMSCLNGKIFSGDSKDIVPGVDKPFSLGFLNNSYNKSLSKEEIVRRELDGIGHPSKTNCNGSVEHSPLCQSRRKSSSEEYGSEMSCLNGKIFSGDSKDIVPGIDKPFISRGFLNNSYNKSLSKEEIVSRELDGIGHPSKTNCNGSVEHSPLCQSRRKSSSEEYGLEMSCLNGKIFSGDSKDIVPGIDKPFISRGFLNNSYNKSLNKEEIVSRELDGIGHPSKTNCNGSVEHSPLSQSRRKNSSEEYVSEMSCLNGKIFSGDSKDIVPGIDKPFISRGFLNNSYNKSLSKDEIISRELDGIGHPSKTSCNGSVEHSSLCQSGMKSSSKEDRPELSCLNDKIYLGCEKPLFTTSPVDSHDDSVDVDAETSHNGFFDPVSNEDGSSFCKKDWPVVLAFENKQ